MKILVWVTAAALAVSSGAFAQTEKENDFSSPPLPDEVSQEFTVGKTALEEDPAPNVEAEVKDSLADVTEDFSHRIPEPQEPRGERHLKSSSAAAKHHMKVAKHKHKPAKHTIAAHAKSKKHSGHHVVAAKAKKHSSNKGRTVASAAKRKHRSMQ